MSKRTKVILIAAVAAAAVLAALWLVRGRLGGEVAMGDVVFVNETHVSVYAVAFDWESHTTVGMNADGSAMGKDEYLAFDAREYPVTVTVYGDRMCEEPLASCVIDEPPAGRWYVMLERADGGALYLMCALGGSGPKDLRQAVQRAG